jgi:hypothetical protein
MKQAWHIFKKDARHLRIDIVLTVALAVILSVITPFLLPEVLIYFARSIPFFLFGWGSLVYPAAMYFLIARVFHEEAVPGTRQFWLTRPYDWKSLVLAKLLFVLVFAHIPLMGMQVALLLRSGFDLAPNLPGFFWSQILTFVCVSLPACVFAILTPNMFAFIGLALVQLVVISMGASLRFGGADWVRDMLTLTFLVLLAVPIFVWQYRSRATAWSRMWAFSIAVAGLSFYLWMPWRLAFSIQSMVSPKVTSVPMLAVTIDPANMRAFKLRNSPTRLEVDIPLSVANALDLASFRADALALTFERSDGAKWAAPPLFFGQLDPYPQDSVLLYYVITEVDREFLRGAGPEFTLRGELHYTIFERRRTVDGISGEVAILGPDLRCQTDGSHNGCTTVFRPGPYLVETNLTNSEIPPSRPISYSPFPARFGIQPLWGGPLMQFQVGPPAPIKQVTIKEPAAHLRQEFEIKGVRLGQFTRE